MLREAFCYSGCRHHDLSRYSYLLLGFRENSWPQLCVLSELAFDPKLETLLR